MENKTFNWSQNNTSIFGQYWSADNAKGIIALVHGMGEHSNRYADFVVPKLNAAGFHVIALDHFGHGQTPGKRGHCPSYDAVLDSVENLIAQARGFFGDELPLFLYGHSMGGNVVANYALRRNSKIHGSIITSPMLRIAFTPPAWKMTAGNLLKNIWPSFQESTGLDANAISRDKEAVAKYVADPLVHDKVTINFSIPFFEAGEYAIANANNLKQDMLVLHGTGDTITSCDASAEFAKNAGSKVTFKTFEGAYHELHNEPEKGAVMESITSWLTNKL